MHDERGQAGFFTALGVGAVVGLLFLVFVVFGSFTTVGVGEVGIVKHWGAIDPNHPDVFDPGFHSKMPFRDDVVTFDTRVQRSNIDNVAAASRDGIDITTNLVVNWHIEAKSAPLILQNVGPGFANTVLAPAIQQSYKDVSGTYAALDMIQHRQELADKARALLTNKMASYHILIDDVAIVNLAFPKAFDEAIQQTQIANQNRAKSQQDQEAARIQAETARIQAEGLAAAQKAQAQTITPEFLQLQAIQKWNGQLPTYLTPNTPLPFIGTAPATK